MDKLSLAFAQRVWSKLEDEEFRTDLERSLARLCIVRGLNREQFHDFNYTLYVYCAQRAGEFDSFRASLKTWMIIQARALIINIVRDRGWCSRTFGWEDVQESDLYRSNSRGDADGSLGAEITLDKLLFTTETPEDILIKKEGAIVRRVVNQQVMIYAEMLNEQERCCLDLLLATGFSISDRELALTMGFGGHTTARKLRKRLYGELGLRLLHFGISMEDVHV